MSAMLAFGASQPVGAQAPGFAERMAPASRIVAEQTAGGDMDARIRQSAACRIMADAVDLLMGPRVYRNEFVGAEKARRDEYSRCVGDRMGKPSEGRLTMRRIAQGQSRLYRDEAFLAEISSRYIAAQDLPAWKAARVARGEAIEAQQAQFEAERDNQSPANRQQAQVDQFLRNAGLAAAAAVVLGLLLLLVGLLPLSVDLNARPARIRAAGRRFSLNSAAGVTRSLSSGNRTESTGGWVHHDGNSGVTTVAAPVVYTVRDDTLYFVDEHGRDQAQQFTNWHIKALPGHRIGVIWAVPRWRKYGAYMGYWNFDLDTGGWDAEQTRKMFRLSPLGLVLVSGGILAGSLALKLYGLSVALIAIAALVAFAFALPRLRGAAFRRRYLPAITSDLRSRADQALSRANGVGPA